MCVDVHSVDDDPGGGAAITRGPISDPVHSIWERDGNHPFLLAAINCMRKLRRILSNGRTIRLSSMDGENRRSMPCQ